LAKVAYLGGGVTCHQGIRMTKTEAWLPFWFLVYRFKSQLPHLPVAWPSQGKPLQPACFLIWTELLGRRSQEPDWGWSTAQQ
jgi:hypothetical protein